MADKLTASISLVIPVYNEKDLIGPCLQRCIEALSLNFTDFEIIIVDDGSTDGTAIIPKEIANKDSHIKIIHNTINLNTGISIQRGLASATKDFVVYNGADLPLAPEDISGLTRQFMDCDVLVLERKSYAGYTRWRWIVSRVNRVLLHLLFPLSTYGINDLNFTQIYRRAILSEIMPLARSPGFTAPEMIIRAKNKSLRVNCFPVNYRPRTFGKGALGKPHDILWSLYDMLRFRLKYLWRSR